MNIIKFSHLYDKLKDIHLRATLVGITESKFEDLPKELVLYDTSYFKEFEKNTFAEELEFDKIPKKGDCIILFFLSNNKIFSTIRSKIGYSKKGFNDYLGSFDKFKYYKSKIGQVFKIELEGRKYQKK